MVSLKIATLLLAAAGTTSGAGETVLLDFSADWCGPCRQMRPVVRQLAAAGYPVREVNVDQNRALAAQYRVESIPCFVLLVDGKEVDRATGPRGYRTLEQMLVRRGVTRPSAQGAVARGQSPEAGPRRSVVEELPSLGATNPAAADGDGAVGIASPGVSPAGGDRNAALAGAGRSCVRLKVEDPGGQSFASGTVVDVHRDGALILTCGHIFRKSGGKGRIRVDTFGERPESDIPGELVRYDPTRDLALVSIRMNSPPPPVRVAPAGVKVLRGDRIVSVGCDHGKPPTQRASVVTAVDKFPGPPHVMISGQPAKGRSGGGLLNSAGQLIGVCNAADEKNHEGLFAATSLLHALLDDARLTYVYDDRSGAPGPGGSHPRPESAVADSRGSTDRRPPRMPDEMPSARSGPMENLPGRLVETGVDERRPDPNPRGDRVGSGLLDRSPPLHGAGPGNQPGSQEAAEVICIIRPRGSRPGASSRVVVIENASAEFVDRIDRESRPRDIAPAAATIRRP